MTIQKDITIGEVVAQNFRAAQVFEQFGLDFCCGGKKTIDAACSEKGLDSDTVLNELSKLNGGVVKGIDYNSWDLDFLADYIVQTHHSYVTRSLPNIFAHSQKVASVHGTNHPEVIRIVDLFSNIKDELEGHMQKEEKMLFPYIKKIVAVKKNNLEMSYPPFGNIQNPITVMENEHEGAGLQLSEIHTLSDNYTPPEDACTTFKVLYKELNEFEDDLHIHIHLENNILFPKAIELERSLTNTISL